VQFNYAAGFFVFLCGLARRFHAGYAAFALLRGRRAGEGATARKLQHAREAAVDLDVRAV